MTTWLMKTEPEECSIEDFAKAPTTPIRWDGVRNYQARNFLLQMQPGDEVFIYHSSCAKIGIAGMARINRTAYPDPTQFDPTSPYHDPASAPEKPRWQAVDLVFLSQFQQVLPLDALRQLPALQDCPLVRKGNRLSVMPITPEERQAILAATHDATAK